MSDELQALAASQNAGALARAMNHGSLRNPAQSITQLELCSRIDANVAAMETYLHAVRQQLHAIQDSILANQDGGCQCIAERDRDMMMAKRDEQVDAMREADERYSRDHDGRWRFEA